MPVAVSPLPPLRRSEPAGVCHAQKHKKCIKRAEQNQNLLANTNNKIDTGNYIRQNIKNSQINYIYIHTMFDVQRCSLLCFSVLHSYAKHCLVGWIRLISDGQRRTRAALIWTKIAMTICGQLVAASCSIYNWSPRVHEIKELHLKWPHSPHLRVAHCWCW